MGDQKVIIKIGITCLVFMFFATICIGKGSRGYYYLTGTACDYRGKPLPNKTLQLIYNGDTTNIKTSKTGEFIAKIELEIPCMSGAGMWQENELDRERFINSFNSEYLIFVYGKRNLKVANRYRMFTGISSYYSTKEQLSYYQDLQFEK